MELGELSLQGGADTSDIGSEPQGEVIVERDYSLGTIPRFESHFPQQLQGRVSHEEFEHTLSTINGFFFDSENLTAAQCLESLFGCLTFYTYYLCCDAKYTKNMKRLSAFLESENNRVYKPAGFLVLNPLSNGLLYILDFRRVADRGGVTRSAENSKDV
ncbi:HDCKB03P, putative [Acanthamoeba castellanii str. Neff]|uniref:Ras modification protein ERF4 n=1 Tax=Acanthamoeba castellanii (strain ATCC 30010 / Neff) TaxID=1257118 RepID=L8GW59_ACACF|nr:HDCKB03P, putative [Acanthamoeba castellanii str. Neff]ELR17147.1 HDCKB03P, putative [Acanthamoeba castellanii str. Neff]